MAGPSPGHGSPRVFWTGVAYGGLCALFWGVQAVVSRQSALDGLTATDVTVLRFLVAGLVLSPLALRMRPFPAGPLGLRRAMILSALVGAPYSLLLVGGVAFAPAIHSAVIGPGLIPIIATVLAYVTLGERATAAKLAGLALIVVGLGVFSFDAILGTGGREGAWRGDILFACGALMWATFGFLAKRWNVGAVEGTVSICVLSLLSMPLWAAPLPMRLMDVGFGVIALQAIYQGLIVGVLCLFLYTRCVALLGPARAALFVPLVPIFTLAAGALFLGERPSALEVVGMLGVVSGMIVALRSGRG